MKRTIRFALLAFLLVACMVFAMTACGKQPTPNVPPTPPPTYTITFVVDGTSQTVTVNEGDVPAWQGDAPTRPDETDSMGEVVSYAFAGWDKELTAATADTTYTATFKKLYTVYWMLSGVAETTKCAEGEIPTPPAAFQQTIQTAQYDSTFSHWQPTPESVTENGMQYRAVYDHVLRTYTITFKVGEEVVGTKTLEYGATVNLAENLPVSGDKTYAVIGECPTVSGDAEYQCALTALDPEQLTAAYNEDLLAYTGTGDNGVIMKRASAVQYLLIQQRSDPNEQIRDRIVENLRNLIAGGNEPYFDLEPYWNYPMVAACLAMAKDTASVWGELTALEIEKLDMIMKCYAIICALGTDDMNDFKTGPALQGNFGKNNNPNYRLANVPQILFCKAYFGSTEATNQILKDFDYDEYVAKFEEYGFTRALARWTITPPEDASINFTHPRDFMNGKKDAEGNWMTINAYLGKRVDPSGRLSTEGGGSAGSGKGIVAVGERGYTYKGFTLDQVAEIFNNLLEHNYSGGYVISTYGKYPTVPNDHYPTTNDKGVVVDALGSHECSYILSSRIDENGQRVYYYEQGKKSICEGMLGMMLEFKSSDGGTRQPNTLTYRSSASYTLHDFIMVVSCLAGLEELDMYDLKAETNKSVAQKMWVGNTDFLYKLGEGYMSFSLGKPSRSTENANDGYYIWKSYWNQCYADNYKLENFERHEVIPEDENNVTTIAAGPFQSTDDVTKTFKKLSDVIGKANIWENSLFFEFTLLHDDDALDFGIRLRSSLRTDRDNRADIVNYAGGKLVPSAKYLTPIDGAPMEIELGAYGWHRIALQYHQGATANEASKSVDYSIVITLYVDGQQVGQYSGNVTDFIEKGWLNYSATYDESVEGHLVYSANTPQPAGENGWKEGANNRNNVYWQFYKNKCYNDETQAWFLRYKDETVYVGKTLLTPMAKITYVLNDGSFASSEIAVNGYVSKYQAYLVTHFYAINVGLDELPTPEREGYTFTGWYTTEQTEGEPGMPDYSSANGITLYAGWEKNS